MAAAAKAKAEAIINENPVGMNIYISFLLLRIPAAIQHFALLLSLLAFGSASYPINNLYHANQPIFFLAVFSKSYCPYCRATKELLSASGAQYYAVELDQIG